LIIVCKYQNNVYLCSIKVTIKLKKMNTQNTITSRSGKKEASIVYTIAGGYRATIVQIVNTGIEIEKDFFLSKNNFSTYEKAAKWALKNMN